MPSTSSGSHSSGPGTTAGREATGVVVAGCAERVAADLPVTFAYDALLEFEQIEPGLIDLSGYDSAWVSTSKRFLPPTTLLPLGLPPSG